jgi:predicted peptidase
MTPGLGSARHVAVSLIIATLPLVTRAAGLDALTLQVTGGTSLTPAFQSQTMNYRARVQSDIAVVTVAARAADAGAQISVSVNGKPVDAKTPMQATVAVGANQVDVQVSDATGRVTDHYQVSVEREDMMPVVNKFLKKNFVDVASGRTMPYRLFVPEGYDATKSYPLVVFLHGGGERGDDNEKTLTANEGATVWAKPQEQARRAAFVLVPQARAVWDGGFGLTRNAENKIDLGRALMPSDDLRTAQKLLQQVLSDYAGIDRKRLYLTGISQGGLGTWAWNVLEPELFAAMVPVCGGGEPSRVAVLKNKPLWAFHAAADPIVPATFTGNAVAAVRKAGGQVRYTEYDTSTFFFPMAHFAWVPAYQNDEMRDWMFKQSR